VTVCGRGVDTIVLKPKACYFSLSDADVGGRAVVDF